MARLAAVVAAAALSAPGPIDAGHMVFHQHADRTVPAMSHFFARTLGGGEVTVTPQPPAEPPPSGDAGPRMAVES